MAACFFRSKSIAPTEAESLIVSVFIVVANSDCLTKFVHRPFAAVKDWILSHTLFPPDVRAFHFQPSILPSSASPLPIHKLSFSFHSQGQHTKISTAQSTQITMSFGVYEATRRARLLELIAQVDGGDQETFAEVNRSIHLFTRTTPMPVYDMCCFNAVMSLVFPTWLEAEVTRSP